MVDYNYYSGGYGSGDYSYGSSSSSSSSNKSTIGSSGYTSVDAIAKQSSSGLGAKTSSKLDQKGYTPTKSKSTASAKAYQAKYDNDDDSPSSPSVVIQASSVATQQAGGSPHIQTKTANPISWYDSDAFNTPDKPVTAYVPPSPSEIESYVYNASKEMEKEQIDTLLAEAMGYSTPAAGLTIVEDRPLTAEERERFKPLLDMAKDRIVPSITTTELPSMQEMQQKEDEAIREAIKQIQNGVPLDQVLTNITDIAYRGEDEAPEETPVGDSFVGGEYQTAEIKPLTKEGILAKLGEVDPETGQPIQSAADVIAKDVASKQGLGAKTTVSSSTFTKETDAIYNDFVVKKEEGDKPHVGKDSHNLTLPGGVVATGGLMYDGKEIKEGKNKIKASELDVSKIDTSNAYKTVNNKKIKRSDYSSDKEWTKAIIQAYTDIVKDRAGEDSFNKLSSGAKQALTKLAWNNGEGWAKYNTSKALYKELAKDKKDINVIGRGILNYSTISKSGASIGIAKARANAWNKMTDDHGFAAITKIEADNTGTKTKFKYYDVNNNLLYTETTSRSPDIYANPGTTVIEKGVNW